jgi:precorrin-2 methylase
LYGISVNAGNPQLVSLHAQETLRAWEKWVITSTNQTTTPLQFEVGKNTLRVYMVHPGVVFQRIEIDTGQWKPTFLGPPTSLVNHISKQ